MGRRVWEMKTIRVPRTYMMFGDMWMWGAGRAADARGLAVSSLPRNRVMTIARRGESGSRKCCMWMYRRLETNEAARAVVWAPGRGRYRLEAIKECIGDACVQVDRHRSPGYFWDEVAGY
ncbi:hypothetical protein RSAG8_10643, partial [Rhizoctonia solani AG-8 WAC10335]